jgi:hypothetical protein
MGAQSKKVIYFGKILVVKGTENLGKTNFKQNK